MISTWDRWSITLVFIDSSTWILRQNLGESHNLFLPHHIQLITIITLSLLITPEVDSVINSTMEQWYNYMLPIVSKYSVNHFKSCNEEGWYKKGERRLCLPLHQFDMFPTSLSMKQEVKNINNTTHEFFWCHCMKWRHHDMVIPTHIIN